MLFEYVDYVKYLKNYIQSLPKKGRGFRSTMAKYLGCKTSFISQIFSGKQDLNIEQAFLLNDLLKHGEKEGKYFLTLVQLARAGNKPLKEYFRREAEEIRSEALRLKNRIESETMRSKEDEFKYFSSADYAYVHILLTIPDYQTKEALLKKLNFAPKYLERILDYLLKLGFAVYKNGRYLPGPSIIHLPDDSSIISTHHTNWRIQAIKACQSPSEMDLHYSSIVSISQEDFLRIKSLLVEHLKQYREIIKESPCEKAYCFSFDIFEMN